MPIRRPHLRIPFEVVDGQVASVEQDTMREVEQCVLVCLSTPLGSRMEDPDFGVQKLLFKRTPLKLAPILAAVEACEPRASLMSESAFEDLVERVTVEVEAAAA